MEVSQIAQSGGVSSVFNASERKKQKISLSPDSDNKGLTWTNYEQLASYTKTWSVSVQFIIKIITNPRRGMHHKLVLLLFKILW